MTLTLPTIKNLVERQLALQQRIEDGRLDVNEGKIMVENLSKIIASVEIAEQAQQDAPQEDYDPAFVIGEDATEEKVRGAMLAVYEEMESGKLSGTVAITRIRALDLICKSLKNQVAVQVNVNAYEQMPKETLESLQDIELRLRNYHEQLAYASTEIARLTGVPLHIILERVKEKRHIDKRPVSKRSDEETTH